MENTPPSEDGEAMRKNAVNLSSSTERRWFAVYTTCRHEKRVAQHLEQRHIEHFLPLYRTQHRWKDGSHVVVDLPLFPGYVFVRVDSRNRVGVLAVPGVVSMIGTALRPAPLPDFEVEKLWSGLDPVRAEPHHSWAAGANQEGRARRSGRNCNSKKKRDSSCVYSQPADAKYRNRSRRR